MLDKIEFPRPLKLSVSRANPIWWASGPALLAVFALSVSYLSTHTAPASAFILQRGFALICHQRPDRSFWIFGAPVAVCARCLGIYLGAGLGLLLRTSRSIARRLLVAAAAVNLLDAVTEAAGLHGNWMYVRFVLGLALGATAALLISSAMQSSARFLPLPGLAPQRLDSTN
jgi:uncharacterized membrane protein